MSTFPERLTLAIAEKKAAGISQNAIEERAGLKTGYLSTLRQGKRVPTFEKVVSLADALGVRLEWLIAERGPMRAPAVGDADGPAARARAAALALGYSTAAIDAGISDAVASNDTSDPWEILTRIRTKSRVPAPGRLLPSPTVQPLAANEDEPPPTVFSRPASTKTAETGNAPAAKPRRATK